MAKVLSVEIGCSTIKLVEMDLHQKKPRIYKCVEAKTPEGAVRDGYINPEKAEALKEEIRAALKENKIRTRRVLFTVFSGKIISREVTLPVIKEHQIGAMIESNVSEYFPIELDDYKIAHSLIQTYRDGENAGRHKVLVMAVENALIAGYEKLAADLGLYIADIDYTGNSVIQATKKNAGAEAIMVVKAERENALITILQQGVMMMQRTVNYQTGYADDGELPEWEEINHVLTGTATRVIDFFASNNESKTIEQIYLIGEGSRTDDLMKLMQEQTGISCRMLEYVRGTVIGRQAESAKTNLFAAAIGAGISSVGIDVEKEKERHETNYVSACILMLVFFAVLAAALLSMALIPYNSALAEQSSLQRKQEQLEPARAVHDQYVGLTDFIAQIRYGRRLTEHSNDGIIDFLTELEEKMPSELEMVDFSSDDSQCVMTMRVEEKETAAGIIKTLRGFESLESVTVESIVEEETEDSGDVLKDRETTVSFTVTCVYYVDTPVAPVASSTAAEAATEAAAE